ncbi:MAG TPA: UDP-glucuronic acid decarboxylase family protein [Patescibacteria group bacterium]|nr:UDP-glucuronic acid decarboxylase family protein [Patescibacteria group bacterium]
MIDTKSKRILVTGGAGFLGSHICERLISGGHEVICLDDLSSGLKDNISRLLDDPKFEFIEQDVTQPLSLQVDEIYNLACPASPAFYMRDPVHTIKTCVNGAINMLELARELDAAILQASTSEVYGDPELHPQAESYRGRVNPIGVRGCYAEGKRCAESLFFDYRRRYGTRIKIARIFNTYGPRMRPDDGRVISNFIVQTHAEKPLTVYGDGRQTRAFCYVDDMVDGLIGLMETDDRTTGPINLGCPDEISILDLARLIARESAAEPLVIHLPQPGDDPRCRKPDITEAKALLQWEPTVPLREGIRRVIDHCRCNAWAPPGGAGA